MQYDINTLKDLQGNIEIKTFYSSVDKTKRRFSSHHHVECELSLFISGKGIYQVNDNKYYFEKDDIFIFGPDEVHCITEIDEKIILLNIQFSPQILWNNAEDLSMLKIFYSRNNNFTNKIDISNKHTKFVKEKIIETEKEFKNKKIGYKSMIKCNLYNALLTICREYNYIDYTVENLYLKNAIPSIKKAMKYIDSNYMNKITLKEISETALLSENYFCAMFKKLNGISTWRYIMIKRVNMAINLIKTTDYTMYEIALKCGFNSSSNFYKVFLMITGNHPSFYRV